MPSYLENLKCARVIKIVILPACHLFKATNNLMLRLQFYCVLARCWNSVINSEASITELITYFNNTWRNCYANWRLLLISWLVSLNIKYAISSIQPYMQEIIDHINHRKPFTWLIQFRSILDAEKDLLKTTGESYLNF